MLSQPECVFVQLPTKPTHVVPDVVLNLRQLGLRFFGNLDHVEGGIDVTLSYNQGLSRIQLSDDGSGYWGAGILVERQPASSFGFLLLTDR